MAHYIIPSKISADSGFYEFIKDIDVVTSGSFKINIFASLRYILYINGKYICEGPCRGDREVRYFDAVYEELNTGRNTITVKVLHQKEKFMTVYKTDKPMLIMDLTSNTEHFETDKTWKCCFLKHHKPIYSDSLSAFMAPCEEIFSSDNREHIDVEELFFFENINLDFSENCSINRFGIDLLTPLKKRPIPMIYPQEEISFNIVKSGKGFIELDAGRYVTAKIIADIDKNSDVKIFYSECYEFEDGKRLRDDTSGFLKGYCDIIHTQNQAFKFESFWFRAFRFIRIEGENPQKALKAIKAHICHYPLDITGSFVCSNENYNKMVTISQNTVLCCMHEIIVDCPHYEQQQYIMDSTVENAVLRYMSHDTRMYRKCLEEFAVSQNKDGLLSANYPSTYTQIIPGFSLFWIYQLRDYLEYSADIDFALKHTGTMDKILMYFDRQVTQKGYISTSPYWDFVDWVPGWNLGTVPIKNNEALTIYNLYYACALKDAVYICRKTNRLGLAKEYEDRYLKLKNIINELCLDPSTGLYRDGAQTSTYSAHTIIWAILSEVAEKENITNLVSHLFDKNINTCSFSMNYYLFRALEKCGMYDKAFGVLENWQKMLDLNCTTWCENPDNPRSECHAWSCAPLYEFSSNVLGVKHSFDDIIMIKPTISNLSFAKGVVPTRFGNITIDWSISDNIFTIEISSPDQVKKHLIMPNNDIYNFNDNYIKMSCKLQ